MRGLGLARRAAAAGEFGRPGRLGPRRGNVQRQQHTAAQARGGGGGTPNPEAASSRWSWAKWALLPAAALAVVGGPKAAGADAYDAARAAADLEEGHRRAEKSLKAAERWVVRAGLCWMAAVPLST